MKRRWQNPPTNLLLYVVLVAHGRSKTDQQPANQSIRLAGSCGAAGLSFGGSLQLEKTSMTYVSTGTINREVGLKSILHCWACMYVCANTSPRQLFLFNCTPLPLTQKRGHRQERGSWRGGGVLPSSHLTLR